MSSGRAVCGLLLALSLWLLSGAVWAESVAALAKKLKSKDFRVRTQAALALGATGSKKAVKPLCGALDDKNKTVRAAAAGGMAKLKRGGVKCLEARLKKEKNKNVLKMLRKAIRLVKEAASGPALNKSSKLYLALAPVRDRTGRKDSQVNTLVRTTIQKELSAKSGYVMAPKGETTNQAKKRLRKYPNVYGYYLETEVTKPEYHSGGLTISLKIQIFDYPGKSLQGSLRRTATMPDVTTKDTDAEDQLITILCKEAMREFVKLVEQLD